MVETHLRSWRPIHCSQRQINPQAFNWDYNNDSDNNEIYIVGIWKKKQQLDNIN